MPKINLLPKNVAELIAAGEVVERPASVIKELVENSIDAGATVITVEIQRGGITYMRVTDNGCGIEYSDVPTAFLRHATSKISVGNDLDSISTLGFRGEALAAVSSVAKVEMLTCTADSDFGTHYLIEGGEEKEYGEIGCPEGTTIIIRDIFYNTPARMKFLKKDISEANACAAVIDRIALSHPEVSFKFIRDGKQTLSTTGDGNVKGTVYSVLGREFSNSLIEVNSDVRGIAVSGLTCKPVACKPTRNSQFTFLNGRLVRSGTVVAAVEQAYKNSAMVGKFPGFVLYVSVPFDMVDVNVHPAKTEVRFSDERVIFDAVYSAIKNALNSGDTRPEIKLKAPAFNPFEHITVNEYKQQKIDTEKTVAEKVYKEEFSLHNHNKSVNVLRDGTKPSFTSKFSFVGADGEKTEPMTQKEFEEKVITANTATEENIKKNDNKPQVLVDIIREEEPEKPDVILIGEAFSTYIVAQMGDSIFMIDKHADHERIIFNRLKKEHETQVQQLLSPATAMLSGEEYDAVINNIELLLNAGFEVEDLGNSAVAVRTVPSFLVGENIPSLISEIALSLIKSGTVSTEREDDLFHTVACKAAIKAGMTTSRLEMQNLAETVLNSKDIMYCPHGRPVAYEIKKRELEKQFGRIQ
ncbi:MAG: DNA mismatch repair endonuclease MutL [Acutalibacteraceae bacterium]|nr:DNA mismatch repair endonuclease MutL [Acutalibacteraceae bacterium]